MLQKELRKPASEILRLNEWALETTGLDGWWAAIQFDRAVCWLGRHVENKLLETDSNGRSQHRLEDILGEPEAGSSPILKQLSAVFGVVNR